MMAPILEVKNLYLYYRTRKGDVKAVDDVSFTLEKGSTLALVGESGCGKSSTVIAITRLLPRNTSRYEGKVILEGKTDLMKLDDETFRREIRWRKISMVFQGAFNALNPVITIGDQVAEPLIIHDNVPKEEALERAKKVLEYVRLPDYILTRYPHELSGGMKQRVVIAMALIMNPDIVILDEPTSALDVITQANIMNLLKRLKKELLLSYIFITHDLSLASELADRVAVMYGGKLVEVGPAEEIYNNPKHPYTVKLIGSVPTLRTDKKLEFIPGTPPNLINPPPGCRFHPRCPYAKDKCHKEEPPVVEVGKDHYVMCWLNSG
ncbi:MAG: ABC transporter ATP-binding protein [Thermoprotei archaeon]|nr:MAG: ABC transporter ATP-binding protein [Thermoprotei archaeon]